MCNPKALWQRVKGSKRKGLSIDWPQKASAEVDVAVAGNAVTPIRRPAVLRVAGPEAAAEHPVRAWNCSFIVDFRTCRIRAIQVPAPFQDIPMQVFQIPGIKILASNERRSSRIVCAIYCVLLQNRKLAAYAGRWSTGTACISRLIARKRRRRPSTCEIFPFSFRR